jgi:hypothetical protein
MLSHAKLDGKEVDINCCLTLLEEEMKDDWLDDWLVIFDRWC